MAPWSREYFPAAMRRLDTGIRDKAIEIANALLREGHDEGFAIRVGIAKAKEWAGLDPLAVHREHDARH